MSSLLRSLRKRVNAHPVQPKPPGKLYAGTIESVTINGRVFPGLCDVEERIGERPVTVFKGRSTGFTMGVLGAHWIEFAKAGGFAPDELPTWRDPNKEQKK